MLGTKADLGPISRCVGKEGGLGKEQNLRLTRNPNPELKGSFYSWTLRLEQLPLKPCGSARREVS